MDQWYQLADEEGNFFYCREEDLQEQVKRMKSQPILVSPTTISCAHKGCKQTPQYYITYSNVCLKEGFILTCEEHLRENIDHICKYDYGVHIGKDTIHRTYKEVSW